MMHDVTIGQISFTKRLGVTIEEVKIGAPVPRKTEITIPFRNSTVDMDDVLGTKTYDDRTITVKFWKRCTSLKEVHESMTDTERWLLNINTKRSFTDSMDVAGADVSKRGLYIYNANVSSLDFSESTEKIMKCTATLKADPYKKYFSATTNSMQEVI